VAPESHRAHTTEHHRSATTNQIIKESQFHHRDNTASPRKAMTQDCVMAFYLNAQMCFLQEGLAAEGSRHFASMSAAVGIQPACPGLACIKRNQYGKLEQKVSQHEHSQHESRCVSENENPNKISNNKSEFP